MVVDVIDIVLGKVTVSVLTPPSPGSPVSPSLNVNAGPSKPASLLFNTLPVGHAGGTVGQRYLVFVMISVVLGCCVVADRKPPLVVGQMTVVCVYVEVMIFVMWDSVSDLEYMVLPPWVATVVEHGTYVVMVVMMVVVTVFVTVEVAVAFGSVIVCVSEA